MTETEEPKQTTLPTGPETMPTMPPPTSGEPYFDAPPGELSRFLKLLMAKGGAGTPPFTAVDLALGMSRDGEAGVLSSEHRDTGALYSVKGEWYGIRGGASFECATGDPANWLLDYLDGTLFAPDVPVRFSYSPPQNGVPKIRLSQGGRTAASSASAMSEIPKVKEGSFVMAGPDGVFVNTDPAKRPVGGSPWSAWAEKGYSVASIPMKEVASMLSAASTVRSHRLNAAVIDLNFPGDGTMDVTCLDPKKTDGDSIRLGKLEGVVVEGKPTDHYSLQFVNAEAFLSSIRLLKTDRVVFVHHPAEARMNICGVEKDAKGYVVMRLTQSIMSHKDPRTKRGG